MYCFHFYDLTVFTLLTFIFSLLMKPFMLLQYSPRSRSNVFLFFVQMASKPPHCSMLTIISDLSQLQTDSEKELAYLQVRIQERRLAFRGSQDVPNITVLTWATDSGRTAVLFRCFQSTVVRTKHGCLYWTVLIFYDENGRDLRCFQSTVVRTKHECLYWTLLIFSAENGRVVEMFPVHSGTDKT